MITLFFFFFFSVIFHAKQNKTKTKTKRSVKLGHRGREGGLAHGGGNIRNAPARSGSADDRLIYHYARLRNVIITCPPKTGDILHNSTIAVSPDPLFRVRVWLARLHRRLWLLALQYVDLPSLSVGFVPQN